MWNRKHLTVFLTLGVITNSELFFKCTNLYCDSKSNRIANYSCALNEVSRYKTLANIEVNFRRQLKNIKINHIVYVRNNANIYTPFLQNVTFNFCQMVASGKGDFFSMAILSVLQTNSKIIHTCPYEGGIILKDFYFDRKMMPIPTVPKRSFKIVLKFYEGSEYLGIFAYYVDVVDSSD